MSARGGAARARLHARVHSPGASMLVLVLGRLLGSAWALMWGAVPGEGAAPALPA